MSMRTASRHSTSSPPCGATNRRRSRRRHNGRVRQKKGSSGSPFVWLERDSKPSAGVRCGLLPKEVDKQVVKHRLLALQLFGRDEEGLRGHCEEFLDGLRAVR